MDDPQNKNLEQSIDGETVSGRVQPRSSQSDSSPDARPSFAWKCYRCNSDADYRALGKAMCILHWEEYLGVDQ